MLKFLGGINNNLRNDVYLFTLHSIQEEYRFFF